MTLTDLTHDEQIILGCLIRMMLRSDGRFSDEEEEQVNRLGADLGGAEAIWHLVSKSAQAYPYEDKAKDDVGKITRPEARALILRTVELVAQADGMAKPETELLAWLRARWT
jgi:hypothetical protein